MAKKKVDLMNLGPETKEKKELFETIWRTLEEKWKKEHQDSH